MRILQRRTKQRSKGMSRSEETATERPPRRRAEEEGMQRGSKRRDKHCLARSRMNISIASKSVHSPVPPRISLFHFSLSSLSCLSVLCLSQSSVPLLSSQSPPLLSSFVSMSSHLSLSSALLSDSRALLGLQNVVTSWTFPSGIPFHRLNLGSYPPLFFSAP